MYQQSRSSLRRGSAKNLHRVNWQDALTIRQVNATAQHYTGDYSAEAAHRTQQSDKYFEVSTACVLSDLEQVELNELCQLQAKWFDDQNKSPVQLLEWDNRTDTESHRKSGETEKVRCSNEEPTKNKQTRGWLARLPSVRSLRKKLSHSSETLQSSITSTRNSLDSGVILAGKDTHPVEQPYCGAGIAPRPSAETPTTNSLGVDDGFNRRAGGSSPGDAATIDFRDHWGYPYSVAGRHYSPTAPPS